MKLIAALFFLLIIGLMAKSFLFSFRSQGPDEYADTAPLFDMKTHLNGEILSEGLIFGPTGRMSSSFVARMYGEWSGNSGTLTEEFTYSTGRQQTRKWFLELGNDNTFTATADDIIGSAKGEISGSTIKMTYRIVLPPEAGGYKLDVTDWLYLAGNGTIMNRSEMRMFGVKVADLVATMRQDPEALATFGRAEAS